MSTATLVTAEQLLRMPEKDGLLELVAGRLRKKPFRGWRESRAVTELMFRLAEHVHERKIGLVVPRTGFVLARDPDTVLAPAVSFIRKDRVPPGPPTDDYWLGAPDLAVEVMSPGDTVNEVDEKARAWLDAGAAIVWVVNPAWRTLTVYRPAADPETLTQADDLDGGDLIPGFRCRVADLFLLP
jgi:Uma2 family endonuclease